MGEKPGSPTPSTAPWGAVLGALFLVIVLLIIILFRLPDPTNALEFGVLAVAVVLEGVRGLFYGGGISRAVWRSLVTLTRRLTGSGGSREALPDGA